MLTCLSITSLPCESLEHCKTHSPKKHKSIYMIFKPNQNLLHLEAGNLFVRISVSISLVSKYNNWIVTKEVVFDLHMLGSSMNLLVPMMHHNNLSVLHCFSCTVCHRLLFLWCISRFVSLRSNVVLLAYLWTLPQNWLQMICLAWSIQKDIRGILQLPDTVAVQQLCQCSHTSSAFDWC